MIVSYNPFSPGLGALLRHFATQRSIFVSYHHAMDQAYYDALDRMIAGTFGLVRNNSVDTEFDTEDPDYVIRAIRERYIDGTSCTVLLCGPLTRWRKYVDWEIKASLDGQRGLLGVNLPNNPPNPQGQSYVPDRFYDNYVSGYAVWVQWNALVNAAVFKSNIEAAIARPASLISNTRSLRGRNGPP